MEDRVVQKRRGRLLLRIAGTLRCGATSAAAAAAAAGERDCWAVSMGSAVRFSSCTFKLFEAGTGRDHVHVEQ